MKSLSSHLIDVETTNDHLKSENTKLKTEMQNLKKNLKTLDKKIETIENGKKHSLQEQSLQTDIPICQQSSNEPSETNLTTKQTSPGSSLSLTNNPFHVLTTIKDIEDNPPQNDAAQHTPLNKNNPELSNNIHSREDTSEQKENTHPSGNTPKHNDHVDPKENNEPIRNHDIILLMDSNGKFIDPKKFSTMSVVHKLFSPTIASTIEILNKEHFGTPTTIVIHTGTNDIEKAPLDTCFEHFQTLIDIAAQKYPRSKVIISSLLVRNDIFDHQRSQLNSRLGRLHSYPNVHFVKNETITRDMLYDQKHVKRRSIGVLVSNLKDCTFNRISKRPYMMPINEIAPKQNTVFSTGPKLNHQLAQPFSHHQPSLSANQPGQPSLHQQPRPLADKPTQLPLTLFANHPTQSSLHQQPRLYAEVVKSSRNHLDSVDPETMRKLLNIYEMIHQS